MCQQFRFGYMFIIHLIILCVLCASAFIKYSCHFLALPVPLGVYPGWVKWPKRHVALAIPQVSVFVTLVIFRIILVACL
jgi:hypothetical protein